MNHEEMKAENERLKAEVERLTKENITLKKYGDDMYKLALEDSTGMWTFTEFQKWKSLK